jgi:segregation and condensation protein A
MSSRHPITIRVDRFEGPLDLLLYLIQSHEMDISKVSISHITDQYLTYVRLMQELNFDTASEFLVMAATLLHWKSKSLLPKDENAIADAALAKDEEMSQEDLIRQLMEHQRFLEAGQNLGQLPLLGEDVFTRPYQKPDSLKVWKEMNLSDLTLNYQDGLVKARRRVNVLKKETVSLSDKIEEMASRLQIGKITELREFLPIIASRPEVVVTFLATLELARLKKMKLYQEKAYEDIYIELLEAIKNTDIAMVDAFGATMAHKFESQPEVSV